MSALRLPYSTLSPDAYKGFSAAKKALNNSALGQELIELVYLRVSQINGCALCLEMHAGALRARNVPEAKLDSLCGWRVSTRFESHFSDTEISDLTFVVSLMSAFNRLAIGMRQ